MERETPIRIIAVDGGGVGGVIPARVIERLAEAYPDLIAKTDLFAGTSTGGLIALGLAKGLSPKQVGDLYRQNAKTIFGPKQRRYRWQWLYKAKYQNDGLKEVVTRMFGGETLKELAKPVFIPVVALQRPDGKHVPAGVFLSTVHRLFNEPKKEKYRSGDWSCVDAALATSAAPTYFPAYKVRDPKISGDWLLWDGGLVANNPALSAICELKRFDSQNTLSFQVLSFGTGYRNIPIDAGDWGRANAASSVVSSLFDVSVGSTAFYLGQMFEENVIRATPDLQLNYEIDDAGAVDRLIQVADDYCHRQIQSTVQPDGTKLSLLDWVKKHW